MGKSNDSDISNAELLKAVNAGFTAMQKQFDDLRSENAEDHVSLRQEIQQLREENSDEHATINRKLDGAIDRLDEHERRIEKLEPKLA